MDDVNILAIKPLLPPACLIEELPVSAGLAQTIRSTRKKVAHSVEGTSDKLVVIVGPCSIHNVKQAIEYVSTNTTDVRLACKHIRMHRAQIAEIALRSGCSRCSTAYIMCLQLGVQYFISFYLRLFHTHMHDPPSHPIFDFFLCACWHRTPLNNYKARLLAGVQEEFNEDLVLIMRVRYNCRDSVCRLKLERDTTSTSVGRVQHSTSPPGRCIRASKLC